MNSDIEYQIYIGCYDTHKTGEIVTEAELRAMVTSFFEQRKINFTMLSCKGGYMHQGGWFITENSLCINIIGQQDVDMIKLGKTLCMFMNQEAVLVTRNSLEMEYS